MILCLIFSTVLYTLVPKIHTPPPPPPPAGGAGRRGGGAPPGGLRPLSTS
jgi:hypothetical protein